jgi:chromosome segregation ATPase
MISGSAVVMPQSGGLGDLAVLFDAIKDPAKYEKILAEFREREAALDTRRTKLDRERTELDKRKLELGAREHDMLVRLEQAARQRADERVRDKERLLDEALEKVAAFAKSVETFNAKLAEGMEHLSAMEEQAEKARRNLRAA